MDVLYTPYQHQSKNFRPEQCGSLRLRLFLDQEVLVYAVLSSQNQILALKEYRPKTAMEPVTLLDAAVAQDAFLRQEFGEVGFMYGLRDFTLVPRELLHTGQAQEMARSLIREDLDLAWLEQRPLAQPEAVALYFLPFPIRRKAEHYFRRPAFDHAARRLTELGMSLATQQPTILLHLCGNQVLIIALRDQKLQLCNAYTFTGITDIVYFVQLARDMMRLEQNPQVLITGEPEADSPMVQQILKLVPQARIPEAELRSSFDMTSDKIPSWKYAFLTW